METGHGHVKTRKDGVKARCGGPAICSECARELARMGGNQTALNAREAMEAYEAYKKQNTIGATG